LSTTASCDCAGDKPETGSVAVRWNLRLPRAGAAPEPACWRGCRV
jgi:hypothetical protein